MKRIFFMTKGEFKATMMTNEYKTYIFMQQIQLKVDSCLSDEHSDGLVLFPLAGLLVHLLPHLGLKINNLQGSVINYKVRGRCNFELFILHLSGK